MHNDLAIPIRQELYVVEVDGIKKFEHRIFIEALKRGLELKRQYPHSEVKLRDADGDGPTDESIAPKRTWGIGRSFVSAMHSK